MRKLLALFAFLSFVSVFGVFRAHADDPPAPPDTTVTPTGTVFTDAPPDQGVTLSADASCEYMTIYFDSAPPATLDGLVLKASVDDSGVWIRLDPGQTAMRFEGLHSAVEGRITTNDNNGNGGRIADFRLPNGSCGTDISLPPFDTSLTTATS
jgi:hypothetical protein